MGDWILPRCSDITSFAEEDARVQLGSGGRVESGIWLEHGLGFSEPGWEAHEVVMQRKL